MWRLLIVDDSAGFDGDSDTPATGETIDLIEVIETIEAKETTETRAMVDVLSVMTRMENDDAFQSVRRRRSPSPDSFYNIPSTVIETVQTSQTTINENYFDQTKLGRPIPCPRTLSKTSESETDTNPQDSDQEYRPVPPVERKRKRMRPSAPASDPRAKVGRGRGGAGARVARGEHLQGLSKAEKRKLTLKRQKNKEAAARCRQKKIDTIHTLEEAVKRHTEERLKLEATVFDLKKHIRMLEASLAGHTSACRLLGDRGMPGSDPEPLRGSGLLPRLRRPDTLHIGKPRTPTDILFTPSTFASLVDSLRSSPMSVPDCLLATPVTGDPQSSDFKLLTL